MDLQPIPFKTDFSANTICIEWQGQRGHFDNFIVKYRAKDKADVFTVQRISESKTKISNLKSGTLYEIRIYVEDTSGDESLSFKTEVRTAASVATSLLKSASIICEKPAIYALPSVTTTHPSGDIQVHEFFLDGTHSQERTLLLIGASGSGKSALVNSIFNYITNVSFADNFRFRIIDTATIQKRTETIHWYKIRCIDGFKVGFNLNIIEVPGFSPGNNTNIYKKLAVLFQNVGTISAACLVVPSFSRLTEEQRCIFNNILSIFGKDITYVIPMITFDDGGELKALRSLEAAHVPYVEHMQFRFNNSQLLSGIEAVEVWNMRQNTMDNFFGEPTFSVTFSVKKTRAVLDSRIILIRSLDEAKALMEQIERRDDIIQENEKRDMRQQEVLETNESRTDYDKICINCNMCNATCVYDCSLAVRCFWYVVLFMENVWSYVCCICSPVRCCSRICRCSCKRAYCCCVRCLHRCLGCTCSCSFAHHKKELGRYGHTQRETSEKEHDVEDQNVFRIESRDEKLEMINDKNKLINDFKSKYEIILKQAERIKADALYSVFPVEIETVRKYRNKL